MATATRSGSTIVAPDDPKPVASVGPGSPADDFVPPGGDMLFEVIDGVVVECPPMGSLEIDLANFIAQELTLHVAPNGLGRAFVEPLFRLERRRKNRRRPDVAFVSSAKWPRDKRVPPGNAWEMVPDLAVEVVSPSDLAADLDRKIVEYFEAGVPLVWVIYPNSRRVFVFESATEVRILSAADTLDGGSVLPGFRLPLARLFDGDPADTTGPVA